MHFGLLLFNSSELSEWLLCRRKSYLIEYGPKDRSEVEAGKLCGNRFQLILKKFFYWLELCRDGMDYVGR